MPMSSTLLHKVQLLPRGRQPGLPCRAPSLPPRPGMQRDLVLRWLEQISALIAKLLRRDPTIDITFVEDRLADAETQLLGPLRLLLERLQPESAAELRTDPLR